MDSNIAPLLPPPGTPAPAPGSTPGSAGSTPASGSGTGSDASSNHSGTRGNPARLRDLRHLVTLRIHSREVQADRPHAVRLDLVRQIRQRIAENDYETDDRLAAAAAALMRQI